MIEFDLNSATPFKPGDVYCFPVRPREGRSPQPATYAIVKRSFLDPAFLGIRAAHMQISAITLMADSVQPWRVAHRDVAYLNAPKAWLYSLTKVTAIGFAACLLITFVHMKWLYADAQIRVEETLPQLEASAKAVRDEISKRKQRLAQIDSLRRNLATQRSMTDVWEELSRVLPDSAYLTDLRVENTNASLIGFSEAASSIIPPIEASDMFEGAEFVSPVVKVPGQIRERFEVRFSVLVR